MLPEHEPLEPAQWRAAWEQVAGLGLGTVRIVACPGGPPGGEVFTGITPVPFIMLCISGQIAVRTADGERFQLRPRDACVWAPGTWVACWHAECPRYLRATIDHDHVFAALKDHDRRRRGGRLVDLYGVRVPGRLDPAAGGLLAGLAGTAWSRPAARAAGELLLWAVHARLGEAAVPGRDAAFLRLQAMACRTPAPSRADAARELGLAPETVSRLCRRHGGCTWRDLVGLARLQRAELRLRGPGGLAPIAADCGFASAGHLIRNFRRRHGVTPETWRRAIRSEA